MIELTVDWQKIITLDDIPNRDADGDDTGASDPLRSEYGNLYGFCDDPRLGNRIVVVKNYTPFPDQDLPLNGSSVFHAVPNLENDVLSGQELSINGRQFRRNDGGDKPEPLPAVGACEARRERQHSHGDLYFGAACGWTRFQTNSEFRSGANKEAAWQTQIINPFEKTSSKS